MDRIVCASCGDYDIHEIEFRTDYANARSITPCNPSSEPLTSDDLPLHLYGHYCHTCKGLRGTTTVKHKLLWFTSDGLRGYNKGLFSVAYTDENHKPEDATKSRFVPESQILSSIGNVPNFMPFVTVHKLRMSAEEAESD